MNQRLRNQEVTAKPRIIAYAGTFKVEWFGAHVKTECAAGFKAFDDAVKFANTMAVHGAPDKVRMINDVQRRQRNARILRKRMITVAGFDPLNVDGYVEA